MAGDGTKQERSLRLRTIISAIVSSHGRVSIKLIRVYFVFLVSRLRQGRLPYKVMEEERDVKKDGLRVNTRIFVLEGRHFRRKPLVELVL